VIGAQKFVKDYLKDIPITWQEFPSSNTELAPILLGKSKTRDKSKPVTTLTGHLDIVFSDISGFKVKQTGQKLFGPGTADMKTGIMVILETVKLLYKKGDFVNIDLLFTSEEEHFRTIDYPDFEKIASDISCLLVFEGDGSLDQEPDPKKKLLVVQRKGIQAYSLKAYGPGGHSGVLSQQNQRHSAIHELIMQASAIQALADYKQGTTINIGKFNGGEALNILAPQAEIVFDARLDKVSEYNRVKTALSNLKANDKYISFELSPLVYGFPVEQTVQNRKLFSLAQEAGKAIGIQVDSIHRGGASDMNRLISFNPHMAAIDFLGPSGGGEHTVNEFLFLNTFDPSVLLAIRLIEKIQDKF